MDRDAYIREIIQAIEDMKDTSFIVKLLNQLIDDAYEVGFREGKDSIL